MRQAVLLGNQDTKRTVYLKKAAEQEGIRICFVDWKDWREQLPDGKLLIKIDPPLWDSSSLDKLTLLADGYMNELEALGDLEGSGYAEFLNTPSVIAELLDKRRCKERLRQAGLPVTEQIDRDFDDTEKLQGLSGKSCVAEQGAIQKCCSRDLEWLLDRMKQCGVYQVFLKPVRGSGAAGVSAFRLQPGTGRMSLYTCAMYVPGRGLVNTKILRNYTKTEEIRQLLDKLLELDCMVERWYAKAVYSGYSYDLRVVIQEGKMDYLLARLSRGPITNLQLNNHPLSADELGLPLQVQRRAEEVCLEAAACFPGLRSAGIDLLLEKGSLKPRIIEMNAQGDLIYQDIYHENIIYRRQAKIMKMWITA